jgi:hypothetical protein
MARGVPLALGCWNGWRVRGTVPFGDAFAASHLPRRWRTTSSKHTVAASSLAVLRAKCGSISGRSCAFTAWLRGGVRSRIAREWERRLDSLQAPAKLQMSPVLRARTTWTTLHTLPLLATCRPLLWRDPLLLTICQGFHLSTIGTTTTLPIPTGDLANTIRSTRRWPATSRPFMGVSLLLQIVLLHHFMQAVEWEGVHGGHAVCPR